MQCTSFVVLYRVMQTSRKRTHNGAEETATFPVGSGTGN